MTTTDLGPTILQRGLTIPALQLVYQTYGTLSADKLNAVLYPTSNGAQRTDIEWLIGPGRILYPGKYFIIIANKFGNGLSSSPSNLAAPHTHDRFSVFTRWALSQAFYREELWRSIRFTSVEDFLIRNWDANFLRRNPDDLLSMAETWTQSDISDNAIYQGDFKAALGAIKARSIIMPSTTDLYFTAEDSEIETRQMPNGEFRPIKSIWGHRAGNPLGNPQDEAFIRTAVEDLMGR